MKHVILPLFIAFFSLIELAAQEAEAPQLVLQKNAEGFRFVLPTEEGEILLGYGTQAGAEPNTLGFRQHPLMQLAKRVRRSSLQRTVFPLTHKPVAPLITSRRHQKAPYNLLCPHYDGSEAPCVVGCVATAMEQVLTYYRRTYTLCDTLHGWETEHFVVPDFLPGEEVNTALIRDEYDVFSDISLAELPQYPEVEAVARLSAWLGAASHMNYGLQSSGTHSSRLIEPLRRAFGFPYVHYIDAYYYDPADYWNLIAREVAAGRPVYYAGSTQTHGAHAFLIDGMDENGFFHVNWGLDGDFDGFFRLDVLLPAQPAYERGTLQTWEGFVCNQEAIILSPDPVDDVTLPDTLHRTGREIEIKSLRVIDPLLHGRYGRVELCVRNTTERALNTTYLLLVSPDSLAAGSDSLLLAHGASLGYTGGDIEPHKEQTFLLHCRPYIHGDYILSVTADADTLLWRTPVHIEKALAPEITLSEDVAPISFPTPYTAAFTHRITCGAAGGRMGNRFTYELFEGDAARTDSLLHTEHQGVQQNRYLYLQPGTDSTLTVSFQSLTPEQDYTLLVRRDWNIVARHTFRLPHPDAVQLPQQEKCDKTDVFYDLLGRPACTDTPLKISRRRKVLTHPK